MRCGHQRGCEVVEAWNTLDVPDMFQANNIPRLRRGVTNQDECHVSRQRRPDC